MATVIDEAIQRWNSNADEFNQWHELGIDEKEELIASELLHHGCQDFIVPKKARWFLKFGDGISLTKGFTSKQYASLWIESLGITVDWRAGFTFRLKGLNSDLQIVNRAGHLSKN